MKLNDDIQKFANVSLFEGFPEEQLRMLAFGAKRKILRSGEFVFRENDHSDGGYIIFKGQVDLFVTRGERELLLASYMESGLVGEMAMITSNKRPASALARTHVELMHIPRELMTRMLGEYPELAALLYQRIDQSMKSILAKLTDVEKRMNSIPNMSLVDDNLDIKTNGEFGHSILSGEIKSRDDGNMV